MLGALLGSLSWGLVLGLAVALYLHTLQSHRLLEWLHDSKEPAPPEAIGHWGDIFDELDRQQKRQRLKIQELKDILARFQQSSSALTDAVVIIDRHHNLEWWNRSADRLLGLKAASDRGKPLINLLRDPRFIRYYRKGHYDEPLQLSSPVTSEIKLHYQITEFGMGDRLLVARDITRLVRLEQTRQDFVANASHELRTPLTVIRGYLETLLDQPLTAPMQRALSQMQTQSARMENLVADLLLLSRLEAGQHIGDELPVNIQQLLNRIQHDAIALSGTRQQQITLECDPNYDLAGQAQELHSAFSNLAFNAVRYSGDGGQISMRWYVDEQGGHVSVTDNGPGIESHHIARLTERFYRVDEGRSSATGGTGLGLAIVKHALQRHGAHLHISSTPGKGSTFSCHFPVDMLIRLDHDAPLPNIALPQ